LGKRLLLKTGFVLLGRAYCDPGRELNKKQPSYYREGCKVDKKDT